jgi:hypothetical protein
MSAMDPAPLVSGPELAAPARKRRTRSVVMLRDSPAPMMKSMQTGKLRILIALRPYVSERPDETSGPTPRPRTYVVMEMVAT